MKRLMPILLLVTLLIALTPAIAYASPLADDAPEPAEQSTGIDVVIGTLGLYAAMMAVLAVGTEVVIDMVRPIFGLQRKLDTEEALAKLKEWLPGTVQDLGLSKEAKESLDKLVEDLEKSTQAFAGKVEEVRAVVQERWPDILKDLALQSADKVLEDHWHDIEPRLKEILGQGQDPAEVRAWLSRALNQLRATSITEQQNQLSLISSVLEEVEKRRNQIQAPARRLWRWLRERLITWGEYITATYIEPDKAKASWFWKTIRFLLLLPAYLEYGWARFRGKLKGGTRWIEGIRKLGEPGKFQPLRSLQEAAQRILEEDTQHGLEEERRVKWLRVISAVVGIVLAATLQVDSFLLLQPVLGPATQVLTRPAQEEGGPITMKTMGDFLSASRLPLRTPESQARARQEIEPVPLNTWDHVCNGAMWVVNWLLGLTPGIILSGLGAAAGSGFWHDQLDRLRSAKEVTGQLKKLTGQGGEGNP